MLKKTWIVGTGSSSAKQNKFEAFLFHEVKLLNGTFLLE